MITYPNNLENKDAKLVKLVSELAKSMEKFHYLIALQSDHLKKNEVKLAYQIGGKIVNASKLTDRLPKGLEYDATNGVFRLTKPTKEDGFINNSDPSKGNP